MIFSKNFSKGNKSTRSICTADLAKNNVEIFATSGDMCISTHKKKCPYHAHIPLLHNNFKGNEPINLIKDKQLTPKDMEYKSEYITLRYECKCT
jgi:hypothetical protein